MTAPASPDSKNAQLLRRTLTALAIAAGFMVVLLESIVTTVAWWKGELKDMGPLDWLLVGLLPLLVFVYVRYFSLFRGGCRSCAVETPEQQRGFGP